MSRVKIFGVWKSLFLVCVVCDLGSLGVDCIAGIVRWCVFLGVLGLHICTIGRRQLVKNANQLSVGVFCWGFREMEVDFEK